MRFRLANATFCGAFLLSAGVQFNDPDPLRWVTVYTLAALLCVFRRLDWRVYGALAGGSGLWAMGVLVSGERGHAMPGGGGIFAEEIVREAGGLLLIVLWMGVLATRRRSELASLS